MSALFGTELRCQPVPLSFSRSYSPTPALCAKQLLIPNWSRTSALSGMSRGARPNSPPPLCLSWPKKRDYHPAQKPADKTFALRCEVRVEVITAQARAPNNKQAIVGAAEPERLCVLAEAPPDAITQSGSATDSPWLDGGILGSFAASGQKKCVALAQSTERRASMRYENCAWSLIFGPVTWCF